MAAKGGKTANVVWLDRALHKLRRLDLQDRHNTELLELFPHPAADQITVCDVYAGYTVKEEERIILAVQVQGATTIGSHIVKLGRATEVKPDLDGYQQCLLGRGLSSRMLMAVTGRKLPKSRFGVVYQNAYRLFGVNADAESPRALEEATKWAIVDREPDASSVERVLIQLFSELYRVCYRGGGVGVHEVRKVYDRKLSSAKAEHVSAWDLWDSEKLRELRRDVLWLATANRDPGATEPPDYLEPYDYMRWALRTGAVPSTLAGWSHGDLHGMNIVVGVSRGEVEHPAVYDFGDMGSKNVLVWDFVKLEMELKTRIMPELASPDSVSELESIVSRSRSGCQMPETPLPREVAKSARRADQLEFALQFELLLARATEETTKDASVAKGRDSVPAYLRSGRPALDKALRIFLRIRREAATWLGFEMGRPNDWCEEYYFALVVYGLLKARWQPDETQLQWALVSAGVAAAQLETARQVLRKRLATDSPSRPDMSKLPSHLVPLFWGRKLWRTQEHAKASKLLEVASRRFPVAVSLVLERSLNIAADGHPAEAKKLVEPIDRFCEVFGDYEALTRIGRASKNLGDQRWKWDRPARKNLKRRHPTWQQYQLAAEMYLRAFRIRKHYFPGINAACLALLTNDDAQARRLAREVAPLCEELNAHPSEDHVWCFATEGEAALILAKPKDAVASYAAALNECGNDLGAAQSMYDQLCRLYWALGKNHVQPIVDLFRKEQLLGKLKRGPFGNCDC